MDATLSWFFVCFIAPRSCPAEPCTSAELPDATKQTKNRARLLLATPQCRLAFKLWLTVHFHKLNRTNVDFGFEELCKFPVESGLISGRFCIAFRNLKRALVRAKEKTCWNENLKAKSYNYLLLNLLAIVPYYNETNCSEKRKCNLWIYNMVYTRISVGKTSLAELGSVTKQNASWNILLKSMRYFFIFKEFVNWKIFFRN